MRESWRKETESASYGQDLVKTNLRSRDRPVATIEIRAAFVSLSSIVLQASFGSCIETYGLFESVEVEHSHNPGVTIKLMNVGNGSKNVC